MNPHIAPGNGHAGLRQT